MKAIGIDLGTTNSVAAYCEPGETLAQVLANSSAERWTPSALSVLGGEVVVGKVALNNAERAPADTVTSVKRLMGRDFHDPEIETVRDRVNYELASGPDGDPRVHVRLRGELRTPADLSAMILGKIKEDAERRLGEDVTHAVITVPAYFKEGQRSATRAAGEQAGLVVRRVLDEPTAAAIAFGVDDATSNNHRILVFDMGGGTFDMSILQMANNDAGKPQFVVLHYLGDNWLGGDDFDYQIVARIVEWVKEHYGEDPSADMRFRLLAKRAAEGTKRELSELKESEISIPGATRAKGALVDVNFILTRAEFETMIEPFVTKAVDLAQQGLRDQSLTPDEISDVLLVGGATMTPLVYETVESLFGPAKVRRTVNPMECVAMGAAIVAANMRGVACEVCSTVNDESALVCQQCGAGLASARAVSEIGVDDVTSLSLGIRAVQGSNTDVFVPIIPKGTPYPLPAPRKETFTTTDQRIKVPLYEGNSPQASRNSEQGELEWELPEGLPPDSKVEVSLNFSRDRIITVTIGVPGTSAFVTKTVRYDQPRTPPPAIPDQEGTATGDELGQTIETTLRFLDMYEQYMEPYQAARIRDDIDRASKGLGGPQMISRLVADVYSCDVATRLFVADRATDGATMDESRDVNEAARVVREAWDRGDHVAAREKSSVLNAIVQRVQKRREGITEIADQDLGYLLRWSPAE